MLVTRYWCFADLFWPRPRVIVTGSPPARLNARAPPVRLPARPNCPPTWHSTIEHISKHSVGITWPLSTSTLPIIMVKAFKPLAHPPAQPAAHPPALRDIQPSLSVWIYVCLSVWMYVCMSVWIYVCEYACLSVCLYVSVCVCLFECMCLSFWIYVWLSVCKWFWVSLLVRQLVCVRVCLFVCDLYLAFRPVSSIVWQLISNMWYGVGKRQNNNKYNNNN